MKVDLRIIQPGIKAELSLTQGQFKDNGKGTIVRISMKFHPFKSCNCNQCKHSFSKTKKWHKKRSHRLLRHSRDLLVVSSGYKA